MRTPMPCPTLAILPVVNASTSAGNAILETMDDSGYRDEIVRLEAQIEELAAKIENCRKFILAGRIAVVIGCAVLVAMLPGLVRSDPSMIGLAAAAVLGGIVVAVSNRSTAQEASNELSANEAKRNHLNSRRRRYVRRPLPSPWSAGTTRFSALTCGDPLTRPQAPFGIEHLAFRR
jgi:hypothetical protein